MSKTLEVFRALLLLGLTLGAAQRATAEDQFVAIKAKAKKHGEAAADGGAIDKPTDGETPPQFLQRYPLSLSHPLRLWLRLLLSLLRLPQRRSPAHRSMPSLPQPMLHWQRS